MTSRDFVKGIDITGLTSVSASELDQLVDAARTADDKGLNIVTTDSALDTPVVPNPDIMLEGVLPTFWKRYIWIRVPFNNTGFVYLYAWNGNLVSDVLYLKWQSTSANIVALTAQVATAIFNITNLQTHQITQDVQIALVSHNTNINSDALDTLGLTVAGLQATIINAIWPIGSYRITAKLEADSGSWCIADGRALNRIVYASLFAAIATLYGVGDGATTFNIPDCRSRMLIGASFNGSVPAGLTQRIPQNPGGEETHLLTGDESGVKAHNHIISAIKEHVGVGYSAGASIVCETNGAVTNTVATDANVAINAITAHNNMPPFIAGIILLRIA